MSIPIAQQISLVAQAPIPFLLVALTVAGIVWRVLKWRYESIVDGLEHRLKLRDDTIERYEEGGHLPGSNIEVKESAAVDVDRLKRETAPSAAQTDLNKRDFLAPSVTFNDLRAIYDGKTQLQADRHAKLYIGKWMEITGKVRSVYDHSNNTIRLRLLDEDTDAIGLRGLWLTFREDRSILETLKIGDTVVALGKIEGISQFDIELEDCELIKAE